ncbi:MAG: hypothetical protein PUC06_05600 [Oscillospiraceae bacterium]|nr:hypothetical protein [Oscillospiraceae bacterium]
MLQKKLFLPVLLLSALCGAAARFYNLRSSVDAKGMTISGHSSTVLLIVLSVILLGCLLALSIFSPGRSGHRAVIPAGRNASFLQMTAGCGVLLSVLLGFVDAQADGASVSALVLLLLGLAAGVCLILLPRLRRRPKSWPPALELIPVLYLIIRLVLNFREWSTDPIVPDYCPMLFAMIFLLLSVYYGAGFVFSQGKPRRTLFFTAAAVYFAGMSALDGFCQSSVALGLFYLSFLLWLLPVVPKLLEPHEALKAETGKP